MPINQQQHLHIPVSSELLSFPTLPTTPPLALDDSTKSSKSTATNSNPIHLTSDSSSSSSSYFYQHNNNNNTKNSIQWSQKQYTYYQESSNVSTSTTTTSYTTAKYQTKNISCSSSSSSSTIKTNSKNSILFPFNGPLTPEQSPILCDASNLLTSSLYTQPTTNTTTITPATPTTPNIKTKTLSPTTTLFQNTLTNTNQYLITTKFLLFDLDGTLINSTPAVETFWHAFAATHSLSSSTILATSHGRRTVDVIREHLPEHLHMHTVEYANSVEIDIPVRLGHLGAEIPGARQFVQDELRAVVCSHGSDDDNEIDNLWAIVTSASRGLAKGWLRNFGWKEPKIFVSSDRVSRGKPDPLGYKLAAKTLRRYREEGILLSKVKIIDDDGDNHDNDNDNDISSSSSNHHHQFPSPPSSPTNEQLQKSITTNTNTTTNNNNTKSLFSTIESNKKVITVKSDAELLVSETEIKQQEQDEENNDDNCSECLIFEDAPAGIEAAKRAGAQAVIGLATTYTNASVVLEAGADYVVQDMRSIHVVGYDSNTKTLQILLDNPIYTPFD